MINQIWTVGDELSRLATNGHPLQAVKRTSSKAPSDFHPQVGTATASSTGQPSMWPLLLIVLSKPCRRRSTKASKNASGEPMNFDNVVQSELI